MSENRVTTADLSSGCRQATASPNLVQWDRGQILKLTGVTLPLAYNVEFTTPSSSESTTMIGNADGVEIPDALLETGEPIVAYVVLHDTQNDRESEYWVTIVVRTRQRPEDIDPDADQMVLIDQLIAALDEGVDQAEAAAAQAEAAVEKYPRVINGNWYVWDEATEEWIDTEVPATGEAGVGIASVTLNDDYTLTLTFTDGDDWTSPVPIRGAQGATGATGATPNLSIGTVSTLAAGAPATASISGTPENPVLSLGIPKGADGDVSSASMASTFSSSTAYTKGTMVWYSGQLYEFTADHAAGAWTGSDARAVKVGEEVSTLKSALNLYNSYDLLYSELDHGSHTESGDTFEISWDESNLRYDVTGTALSSHFWNVFINSAAFPKGMAAGKTVSLDVESSNTNIYANIYYRDSTWKFLSNNVSEFTIPAVATGLIIRINAAAGTYNDHIFIRFYGDALPNFDLTEQFKSIYGIPNPNAKLRSFGNSIMTGAVYPTGTLDHLAAYENSPYGNVAGALKVPKANVTHTMLSSTGLVYDAGNGSFLANIKITDLTNYDYLLTQFFHSDLNTLPLGSMDSTAADGTIAGAVIDLVNYVKTSNGMCKLVLVSAPPVYNANGYKGADVFTAVYSQGASIQMLDILLRRLAKKYGFIYLDWEDLPLSYYYQNYTYQNNNVHANNENTYRVMGEYLGMKIKYLSGNNAEDNLADSNAFDLLSIYEKVTKTESGVTFDWKSDGICYIRGTSTAEVNTQLYGSTVLLPEHMKAGEKYYVVFNSPNGKARLTIRFYASGAQTSSVAVYSSQYITIPAGTEGVSFRITINNSTAIDETVVCRVLTSKTNADIADQAETAELNIRTRNSFDVLPEMVRNNASTESGIDFTWQADGSCLVSGTSTSQTFNNMYVGQRSLPAKMSAGKTYFAHFYNRGTASGNIRIAKTKLRLLYYKVINGTNTNYLNEDITHDKLFTIPSDATGVIIRLNVSSGLTVNEYVDVSFSSVAPNWYLQGEKSRLIGNALFTFIDDDGYEDGSMTYEKVGYVTGTRATIALPTYRPENHSQGSVTWDDVERRTSMGFEYVSHMNRHNTDAVMPSDSADYAAYIANLEASQVLLRAHGCNSKFLVYVGGQYNDNAINACVRNHVMGGVCIGSHTNVMPIDRYKLNRYGMTDTSQTVTVTLDDGTTTRSVHPIKTFADFKTIIDGVFDTGGWCIFMSHWNNNDEYMYTNQDVVDRLVEVIEYITQNGGKVVTLGEGFEMMKNRCDESGKTVDFYGNKYY